MNNSVQKTKNTWQDGLVMDFSPDNTSATTLTAALNATFITNNGNDVSLQNDMGNGRVETAYLPEGYIPVGTCEFGDIIYIVSYNPLTNKSQIGCFPSPERNISSEELHNFNQSISASDFQEFKDGNPTGKLKTTSVKKVLIDKKKLNPGDKYIVYTDNKECLTSNAAVLSNWNQSLDPKYIKLSIVSIEDGGKITYLDSTTKWYDIDDEKYKISYSQNNKITGKDDIDSYRNMLNSGWSIFSSKVSGKLAILAELEIIDTFSCFYSIEKIEDVTDPKEISNQEGKTTKIKFKKYSVRINYDCLSKSESLNPSYLCLTKSKFSTSEQNKIKLFSNKGYYFDVDLSIPESNTNSGWVYSKDKNFDLFEFEIPYSEIIEGKEYRIQSPDLVYSFQITPAMDFGRLDHLAVDMTIDFNKIGTGEVNITKWRYHNQENVSILQYGLEVYPKPGHKVNDVSIEFYDNTGLAGIYYVNNKESYTGIFTEYLGLNGENINSKFSRYKSNGGVIGHKGLELSKKPEIVEGLDNPSEKESLVWNESYVGEYLAENNSIKWYQNDAGTLYSNILYLAKIIVSQSDKTEKIFYRWFWTNDMYNQYFYSFDDFQNLKFELNLDVQAIFESTSNYKWKEKLINNLEKEHTSDSWIENSASTNIQFIGQDNNPNINMYIAAGLQDTYGCFTLYTGENKTNLEKFNLDVYFGDSTITNSISEAQYEFSQEEQSLDNYGKTYLSLTTQEDKKNKISGKINGIESITTLLNQDKKPKYKDAFGVKYSGEKKETDSNNTQYVKYSFTLNECYYISQSEKQSQPLTLSAVLFNNAYTNGQVNTKLNVPIYIPIIDSVNDLKNLGIDAKIDTNNVELYFNSGVVLNITKKNKDEESYMSSTILELEEDKTCLISGKDDNIENSNLKIGEYINTYSNSEFINNFTRDIDKTFFPVYFGGYPDESYSIFGGENAYNSISISKWRTKRNAYDGFTNTKDKSYNHYFINKSFNINSDGILDNLSEFNVIPFLGMKYKDGITLFNQAYLEAKDTNNSLSQKEKINQNSPGANSPYPNFAYIIYLLFSRMYHKNRKQDEQKLVSLRNYVRLAPYTTTLTKDIITTLKVTSETTDENSLILMSGVDFSKYLECIYNTQNDWKNNKELIPELIPEDLKNSCKLNLLSVTKNNQLTLNVERKALDFPNIEDKCYIKYNGVEYLQEDLESNQFYIYTVDNTFPTETDKLTLNKFNNKTLYIRQFDVLNNLKYLFKDRKSKENPIDISNIQLSQCFSYNESKTIIKQTDNFELYQNIGNAWKEYLSRTDIIYNNEMSGSIREIISNIYTNDNSKLENLKTKISNLIYFGDKIETDEGQGIYVLGNISINISTNNSFKKYLNNNNISINDDEIINIIKQSLSEDTILDPSGISLIAEGSGQDYYIVKIYDELSLSDYLYKYSEEKSVSIYKISNPNLQFQYNSKLELDDKYPYNYFGVGLETPENLYGYTGFIRDVVLDDRYQLMNI